tara:strand:+ start:465 stop:1262 length:798 start_codon:yes stop_codon:yes gene_type:complete
MSVFVKKLDGKIPITEIVFFRGLISLIITRVQLKQKLLNPWGNNKRLLLLRGLLGTLALYCVFRALSNLPIATATIIQYIYPTFTAIGACIILKENTKKEIWLAVITGWTGIWFVVQPKLSEEITFKYSTIEISVAILGALLTALAYICVRYLSQKEENLVIIYYFPFVSVLCTLPLVVMNFVQPSLTELMCLINIGILTQIGQLGITKGLSILPASKATSINYVQVLFATIWGFYFFGEGIDLMTLLGSAMILTASLLSINTAK